MASVYELTEQWMQLQDLMEDSDINPELLKDTMEGLECEIEIKLENYGRIIRNLETASEGKWKEASKFTKEAETIDNNIKWMKQTVKSIMELTGINKVETEHFKWGISGNGGKLPLVIAEGITAKDVPEEYRTYLEPEINKEAVRIALDEGKELDFASYGERGKHITFK